MWLRRTRGSHVSPIEFVLKDRDRMVRVQRLRTESDDERPTLGQNAFLGRHEILVVREYERRVRGETRFPNVFAAFLGVDEYWSESFERLLEIGLRVEDPRTTLPFYWDEGSERLPDWCGIA